MDTTLVRAQAFEDWHDNQPQPIAYAVWGWIGKIQKHNPDLTLMEIEALLASLILYVA